MGSSLLQDTHTRLRYLRRTRKNDSKSGVLIKIDRLFSIQSCCSASPNQRQNEATCSKWLSHGGGCPRSHATEEERRRERGRRRLREVGDAACEFPENDK